MTISTGLNLSSLSSVDGPSEPAAGRVDALSDGGVRISASYARAVLQAVEDQDHDAQQLALAEGLDRAELDSAESLPAVVFGRLYQRAILLLKDESLGVVCGERVMPGTFRMMCLCVVHCSTLQAVIQRASDFFDICRGIVVKPHLSQRPEGACIGFALVRHESGRTVEAVLQQEAPVKIRTTLYFWHSLLSWFAGRKLPLKRVEFSFPPPDNANHWSKFFDSPVVFNCSESQLLFASEMPSLSNVQSEQTLKVFLKTATYRLVVPSYNVERLSERVQALFGDDFSQRLPTAGEVGSSLGMSVSTLRRQLAEEGTSYQRLKDDSRRTAAMQYLASKELAFSEVAELLGFDDISAFYRAFRRWSGSTPTAYRESLEHSG